MFPCQERWRLWAPALRNRKNYGYRMRESRRNAFPNSIRAGASSRSLNQNGFATKVLMAWKSAADLLWDANHRDQAEQFYAQIVERFDKPDAAQVIKMAVRGCKLRLTHAG